MAGGFRCQELLDAWPDAMRHCGRGSKDRLLVEDGRVRVQEVWPERARLAPVQLQLLEASLASEDLEGLEPFLGSLGCPRE